MKVTLILATHKAPKELDVILKKLTQQTDSDFEIMLAEDGEDFETAQVVHYYQAHSNLNIIHLTQKHTVMRKEPLGNEGIRRATGTYIVLLDGDCIPHKSFIADHKAMAEPGYFVQGRRTFISEDAVAAFMRNSTVLFYIGLALKGKVRSVFKGLRFPVTRVI
jgi:glycosyltransferase involved in cell wall biosynthesis